MAKDESKAKELIKFSDEDMEALFISETVEVGKKGRVVLRPLVYEQLPDIIRTVAHIMHDCTAAGVDAENVFDPDNITTVVKMTMKYPDLIEAMTGIDRDSFHRLPIWKASEFITKALKVNLAAQEHMAKNFASLLGMITEAAVAVQAATETMEETSGE